MNYVEHNRDILGSQSSLDDAIAAICTDDIVERCSKMEQEPTGNGKQTQDKENVQLNSDLLDFLEDGVDDEFLKLAY